MATIADAFAVRDVGSIAINGRKDWIAIEVGDAIQVIDLAAGNAPIAEMKGSAPAWSPNGNSLAFFGDADGKTQLFIWEVATRQSHPVTSVPQGLAWNPYPFWNACSAQKISWSPDSRRLTFSASLEKGLSAPSGLTASGNIRVFSPTFPIDYHSLSDGLYKQVDPHESSLLPQRATNKLFVVDTRSETMSEIDGQLAQYGCPAWSPTGKTIAAIGDLTTFRPYRYGGIQRGAEATAIVTFDVASGREKRWSTVSAKSGALSWNYRGDMIAYTAFTDIELNGFEAYLLSISDGRSTKVRTPAGAGISDFLWSIDKRSLLAKLTGRFADVIWRFDPATGKGQKIQTSEWHVGYSYGSLGERADRGVCFAAESSHFRGHVACSQPDGTDALTVFDANPQLANLALGEQRRLTWHNSRGDQVDGVVILPPGYKPGRRYPVIVNAYPAPPWDDFKLYPRYEETGQIQAAWGYVVLRPSIRAPHGAYWFTQGRDYTMRGRGAAGIPLMVDDFESGVKHLVDVGIADPDRIGIFGHSNGGWVANMLLVRTGIIKAAVIASGTSNAITQSFFPNTMHPEGVDPATGGNVFDNFDDYVALSPIFQMRRIETPMLLTIGDGDTFWLPQMLPQYAILRAEGRDVELVRYADEGHVIRKPENIADALGRMRKFYDQKLGPGPRP